MDNINFSTKKKLIPVIIQEEKTNEVLMLGYMDKKALIKTVESGWVYFWSRKRKKLWMKGEESGDKLKVKKVYIDCDRDTILILAALMGKAICHTGNKTCFHTVLTKDNI